MKKESQEKEKKIQFFSEDTQRLYQLYGDPPTLKISGVPMHRHTRMNPLQDTETKISAAWPRGIVLDTCTGLGYTAIFSARIHDVEKVITFEKDSNVLEIAKLNPYSNELFTNKKIESKNEDILEAISSFEPNSFGAIIHDPPTFIISPDLYQEKFYRQMLRVLKKGGRIWHYCPEPGKLRKEGSSLKEKIMKRLKAAGFKEIREDPNSSGIVAVK